MSQVTIKERVKGDAIDYSAINDDTSSYNDESTEVDEQNVRRHGLDRRNFDKDTRPVVEVPTGTGQLYTLTGSQTVNCGGSAPATPQFTAGPYALYYDDGDDLWEIVASFAYDGESPDTYSLATTALRWHFKLYYRDVGGGGSWTEVPATERREQAYIGSGSPGSLDNVGINGSMSISRNLRNVVSAGWGSNQVYIGLGIWEEPGVAAGAPPDIDISDLALFLVNHKR